MAHSNRFDCIVVGKGLIGSAAARYLQREIGNVAIIGPDEPTDISKVAVFSSHYDQGRVQRILGVDPVYTLLNKKASIKYPLLEKESGIQFHHPVGCLYVSPHGKDDYLKNVPAQAQQFNLGYQFLETGEIIHKAIPDYHFPEESFGMLEPGPSGHINPLQLVRVQLSIFKNNGGVAYSETASGIELRNNSYHVTTIEGNLFHAPKILVTAGAFSNFMNLLPRPLDLFLKSETVLLAQIGRQEAKRLAHLPSLLYEIDNGEIEGVYAIRPVEYPDGNFYLKMGCNLKTDILFNHLEQIQDWFRNGDSDSNMKILKETLHSILPSIKVEDYKTKRCIISRTKHKWAYIGNADGHQLYVAAGGNGYSAMCSDTLGHIAAHWILHNCTPDEFELKTFDPVFK